MNDQTKPATTPDDALSRYEAPFIEDLGRIGECIGYGRAQQVLGELWDKRHNCAPRGRMGVTVNDARPLRPLNRSQIDAIFDAHQDAPTMTFRYHVTRAIERALGIEQAT